MKLLNVETYSADIYNYGNILYVTSSAVYDKIFFLCNLK